MILPTCFPSISCKGVHCSISKSQLTKAALFVIALLFCVAAITSSYTIGTSGVITFSVIGSFFMCAFIFSCIRSARSVHKKTKIKKTSPEKMRTLHKYSTRAKKITISNSNREEYVVEKKQKKRKPVKTFFSEITNEEETSPKEFAESFQELLNQTGDEEEFFLYVFKILSDSQYTYEYFAEALDYLNWPNPERKEEYKIDALSMHIAATCPHIDEKYEEKYFIHKVIFSEKAIVESKVDSYKLSKTVLASIKQAIDFLGESVLSVLKKNNKDGSIGLKLVFEGFSVALLSQLLPLLKEVDFLFVLEFRSKHKGFCDSYFDLLLEIFKTNKYLRNIAINVDSMSQQKQNDLFEKWKKIRKSRENIEDIVKSIIKLANELELSETEETLV